MITREQVMEVLKTIILPEVFKTPLELNLIRNIAISDHQVEIASPDRMSAKASGWPKSRIEDLSKNTEDVESYLLSRGIRPAGLTRSVR